jgi:hypothetical protein
VRACGLALVMADPGAQPARAERAAHVHVVAGLERQDSQAADSHAAGFIGTEE